MATIKISAMTASVSVSAADLLELDNGGVTKSVTVQQLFDAGAQSPGPFGGNITLSKATPVATIEDTTASSGVAKLSLKANNAASSAVEGMVRYSGAGRVLELKCDAAGTEGITISGGNVDLSGTLTITTGTGNVGWGTYIPTLTNGTNLAASTSRQATYLRVGNSVTVAGQIDVDPTTAATLTQVDISLPIASNFTTAFQLGGVGALYQDASVVIQGSAANDRAECYFKPGTTANTTMTYQFTYQIL